jgi:hypothetical protein
MGKQSKKHKGKAEARASTSDAKEPLTRTIKRIPQSSPPSGRPRQHAETGERDESYNLISVLYHALKGAETCGTYLRDAEAADDEDLVEFFEDTRAEHVARAHQAKQLLLTRLLEAEEEEADEEAEFEGKGDLDEDDEEDTEDEQVNEGD